MKISEFIKERLKVLDNEGGIDYSGLIGETLGEYKDQLKNRQLTANRITSILKQKDLINQFVKVKGKDKKLYIIRNQQVILDHFEEVKSGTGTAGTEANQA